MTLVHFFLCRCLLRLVVDAWSFHSCCSVEPPTSLTSFMWKGLVTATSLVNLNVATWLSSHTAALWAASFSWCDQTRNDVVNSGNSRNDHVDCQHDYGWRSPCDDVILTVLVMMKHTRVHGSPHVCLYQKVVLDWLIIHAFVLSIALKPKLAGLFLGNGSLWYPLIPSGRVLLASSQWNNILWYPLIPSVQ